MPAKTIYVSEQDAAVWEAAQAKSGDESLSRMLVEGLRLLLAQGEAGEDEDEAGDVSATLARKDATTLINRYRQDLRKYGRDRVALAFMRACYAEGAARSRAKRRADETLGVEGRQAKARRAQAARGPEGRRDAARKAAATRKGE